MKRLKNFRFPLLVIVALAQAITGFLLVAINDHSQNTEQQVQLLLALMLSLEAGFVLFFHGLQLNENIKIRWWWSLVPIVLAVILGMLTYLYSEGRSSYALNFATTAIGLLAVYTIPFSLWRFLTDQFVHWRFTFNVIWQFVVSHVLGLALYFGILLAYFVFSTLFDWEIPAELFMHTFVFSVILTPRLIFLSFGVSLKQIKCIDKNTWQYPKILYLVNKFMLIPLVTINSLILGIYFIAAILSGNELDLTLPAFVLALFTPGLIGMASQQPQWKQNRVFDIFAKLITVLTLVYMLPYVIALVQRINKLGFTVYLGHWTVFGIVLSIIGVSFYLKRKYFLAISLFFLGFMPFLLVYTPFVNTYTVAKESQTYQLINILQDAGKLSTNFQVNNEITFSGENYERADEAFRQLANVHGFNRFAEITGLSSDEQQLRTLLFNDKYHYNPRIQKNQDTIVHVSLEQEDLHLDISDADLMYHVKMYRNIPKKLITSHEEDILLKFNSTKLEVFSDNEEGDVLAIFDFSSIMNIPGHRMINLPQANFTNRLQSNKYHLRFIVTNLQAQDNTIQSLEGYLLIGTK